MIKHHLFFYIIANYQLVLLYIDNHNEWIHFNYTILVISPNYQILKNIFHMFYIQF